MGAPARRRNGLRDERQCLLRATRGHGHHQGIVSIEDQQTGARLGDERLDAREILSRADAIRADVMIPDIQDRADITISDAQPQLEQPATGDLGHQGLDATILHQTPGGSTAGTVTLNERLPIQLDADGGRQPHPQV